MKPTTFLEALHSWETLTCAMASHQIEKTLHDIINQALKNPGFLVVVSHPRHNAVISAYTANTASDLPKVGDGCLESQNKRHSNIRCFEFIFDVRIFELSAVNTGTSQIWKMSCHDVTMIVNFDQDFWCKDLSYTTLTCRPSWRKLPSGTTIVRVTYASRRVDTMLICR